MKRVALINDLSGFGKCSLTAAIPVISAMGIQACPFPTAVLSAQTGFKDFFCDDFTDRMDYFTKHWKQIDANFDGIYSGYIANPLQIEKVLYFLDMFQSDNTIYLADPVMGDNGKTYGMYSELFLEKMKLLTVRADIITPNLTELCLLADENYEEIITYVQQDNYIEKIKDICKKLIMQAHKQQTIVVTGIITTKNDKKHIGNLTVSEKECFYIENEYTGISFSGTGDLFASVICGSLVKGLSVKEAMEKAVYFLQDAIVDTAKEGIPSAYGILFEKYLFRLM